MGFLGNLFGCSHDWEKWSDPRNTVMAEQENSIGYFAVAQYRICKNCGIAETRRLPNMRTLDGLKTERAERKP